MFRSFICKAEHHWVTVSNIDCPAGNCVYVYDSLFHTVSDSCIKQIAAILCHSQREIKVVYPAVQRQRGSSDCGAFALAFATSLCSGENPAAITYCQKKLRSHIVSCLENRCITFFPCYSKRKASKVHTEVTIDIICLCRLPEYGNMICCHACGEWYHENCVKAPKAAWEEETSSGSAIHVPACLINRFEPLALEKNVLNQNSFSVCTLFKFQ